MNYSKPIIEIYDEIKEPNIGNLRQQAARFICQYLETRSKEDLDIYYSAVDYMLSHEETQRILLYLPFKELKDAPYFFVKSYMNAWWNLTSVHDASENFHKGDTFEVDARPDGELERVVKCAHLLPWLIEAGYFNQYNILPIFDSDDNLLVQSLKDTLPYIANHALLDQSLLSQIEALTHGMPNRKRLNPLYVSEKRKKWLKEELLYSLGVNPKSGIETKKPFQLLTPDANLAGPFSPNISEDTLKELAKTVDSDDFLLVGGSQLKGYGVRSSDLDTWSFRKLQENPDFQIGSPHAAHIYFNSIWIGGSDVCNPAGNYEEIIRQYNRSPRVKKQSLERIESDLLQYRLLHKGFSRFKGIRNFETSPYTDMDGDCPFYSDEYRRIATMLFAKYVFIPDIK